MEILHKRAPIEVTRLGEVQLKETIENHLPRARKVAHLYARMEASVREAVGLAGPCLTKSAELDVEVDTVEISARLCHASEVSEENKVLKEPLLVVVKHEEHAPKVPAELQALVNAADNLVQCPSCNNVWEYIGSGHVTDCDVYDAQGKEVVNDEARNAFHELRQRCRHCSTTFCKACMASPFHAGVTCSVHSGAVAFKDCRFCRKQLADKVKKVDEGMDCKLEREEPAGGEDAVLAMSIEERAALLKGQLRSTSNSNQRNASNYEPIQGVCRDFDCQQKLEAICSAVLPCGHFCAEDKKHASCGSCLHPDCVEEADGVTLDDFCSICWVEDLRTTAVTRLGCGHVFHTDCVVSRLLCKWGSGAINLSFATCPLCSEPLRWSGQNNEIVQALLMAERLRADLLLRAKVLIESKIVEVADDVPESEAAAHALKKVNFYTCFQCKSAYYGGKVECGVAPLEVDASEYVCGGCVGCKKHGARDLIYKCKFCCSVATFFCFGNTHFCQPCHDRWTTMVDRSNYAMLAGEASLKGCCKETCPLGIDHPPNGEEHLLGCRLCFEKVEDLPEESPPRMRRIRGLRDRRPVFQPRQAVRGLRDPRQRHRIPEDDLARRRNQAAVPNIDALRFVGGAAKGDPLAALKERRRQQRLAANGRVPFAPIEPAVEADVALEGNDVYLGRGDMQAVEPDFKMAKEEKEEEREDEREEKREDEREEKKGEEKKEEPPEAKEEDPEQQAQLEQLRQLLDLACSDSDSDCSLFDFDDSDSDSSVDLCGAYIFDGYADNYRDRQEDVHPKEAFNALAEVLRGQVERRRRERLAEVALANDDAIGVLDGHALDVAPLPDAQAPEEARQSVQQVDPLRPQAAAQEPVEAAQGPVEEPEPFVHRVRAARQFWQSIAH